MNSPSFISPRGNDWVTNLLWNSIIYADKDDATEVDIGLTLGRGTITNDDTTYSLNFPPPPNTDLGGRIVNLFYYRDFRHTGKYDEVVSVPEIKIKCKKGGYYTFVVGRYKNLTSGSALNTNTTFKFNGKDPDDYLVRHYENNQWYGHQWTYNIYFKPGDIFTIKHIGGTFTDFYENQQSWDDDTIRFFDASSGRYNGTIYNIAVAAWCYEISQGANGKVIFTPVNKSSNFEAYA